MPTLRDVAGPVLGHVLDHLVVEMHTAALWVQRPVDRLVKRQAVPLGGFDEVYDRLHLQLIQSADHALERRIGELHRLHGIVFRGHRRALSVVVACS